MTSPPQPCALWNRCVSRRLTILLLSLVAAASAFTQPPAYLDRVGRARTQQHNKANGRVMLFESGENNVYTDDEAEDMEKLIVSLSLEPTDQSRRDRLASLFAEELAKPNGAPKKFTDLFASTLNIVGDRIQHLAAEKVSQNQATTSSSDTDDSDTEQTKDEKNSMKGLGSMPEGRQLWALVDMMVQSKTLVHTQSGELGSKGTFQ